LGAGSAATRVVRKAAMTIAKRMMVSWWCGGELGFVNVVERIYSRWSEMLTVRAVEVDVIVKRSSDEMMVRRM
jgi:hypothetical protein